MIFFFVTTLAL
jgi:hypothetical protein